MSPPLFWPGLASQGGGKGGALPLACYGVAYWHARFPHWPIKIRRCGWGAPASPTHLPFPSLWVACTGVAPVRKLAISRRAAAGCGAAVEKRRLRVQAGAVEDLSAVTHNAAIAAISCALETGQGGTTAVDYSTLILALHDKYHAA
ncbi:hypothetical protein HaLaN_10950 [Haematococcus lacustris]|uniref:Uncharacterized protein n=1 Tax=Haematococcus lacustris TaxID=44745 RepID=A0A699Z6R6_HAELA|nr:hypothetical protein HaLaN_10950 [Haematococcus lacustris]